MDKYPILKQGTILVDNKSYRYEIRQPTVELFDIKFLEVWNEKDESFFMLIFPEHTIKGRIREAVGIDRWKKKGEK